MRPILSFALALALLIFSGCGVEPTPAESSLPSESDVSLHSEDDSNYNETNSMITADGDSRRNSDLIKDGGIDVDVSVSVNTEPITKDINAYANTESKTKANNQSIIGESVSSKVKRSGFNSPEAAAVAYLDALRDVDVKRMTDTFYINKLIENYDLTSAIVDQRSYQIYSMGLPNNNEFIISMNKLYKKQGVLNHIVNQYAMLGAFESGLDFPSLNDEIYFKNETEVSDFCSRLEVILNAPKLDAISIIGFVAPEKIFDEFSDYEKSDDYLKLAKRVFADNATSCFVVFKIDSNMYLLCMDVVDYGGEWFICGLNSYIWWEIERTLNLDHSIQGLVPLFAINAYDDAYNNEILQLRNTVLSIMDTYETKSKTDDKMDIFENQTMSPNAESDSSVVLNDEMGYSSQEDAVRAFLEALRDTDLDRIMSACGVERYAENLDFEASCMGLFFRIYDPNSELRIPSVNDFSKAFNFEYIKVKRIAQLYQLYYLLCSYEAGQLWQEDAVGFRDTQYIGNLMRDSYTTTEQYYSVVHALSDEELMEQYYSVADALVEQLNGIVNALNLDTLSVLGILPLDRYSEFLLAMSKNIISRYPELSFATPEGNASIFDIYFGEQVQQVFLNTKNITGADRVDECIAYFEINGNLYSLFLNTFEYNGKWFVFQFVGSYFSILSEPRTGGLSPISLVIREYGEEAMGFNEEVLREMVELIP